MRSFGVTGALLVAALACAPARTSDAPARTTASSTIPPVPSGSAGVIRSATPRDLGDGGIPPLTAAPFADPPPVEPEWVRSRRKARNEAVDRLLDGKLSEAERRCGTEPPERREACVDAILNEHQRLLGERMERSFRGLELAIAHGEERCKKVKGPKARKRCALTESEKLLSELGRDCTTGTDDEKHDCVIERVLERLGP